MRIARNLARWACWGLLTTVLGVAMPSIAAAQAAEASAALVAKVDPKLDLPQLVVADPLTPFQAIAREQLESKDAFDLVVVNDDRERAADELLAMLGGVPTEGNR